MGEVEVMQSQEAILHDIKPEIAALGDYSMHSVVEIIPLEIARGIDRIQQADLIENGVPTDDWINGLDIPNTIKWLVENKRLYDKEEEDGLEDLLEQDPIYAKLLESQNHYRSSEEYSRLVRLRRTIALRLILEDLKIFNVDAVSQEAPADNVA